MSMIIIWLAVLILMVIIELVTFSLVSIWFVVGSIAALIASYAGAEAPLQIIVFLAVSAVTILFVRPIAKKYIKTNKVKTNLDNLVGKVAVVTKNISPQLMGEVKIGAHIWSAASLEQEEIKVGEYCEVIAIEGAHLVVKKVKQS